MRGESSPFPRRLPYPSCYEPCTASSSRKRQRQLVHERARRWVNALFALFSYWESVTRNSVSRVRSVIDCLPVGLSSLQETFAARLLEDVTPWGRLRPSTRPRCGNKGIRDFVTKMSTSLHSQHNNKVDGLFYIAILVCSDRVALPNVAGQCGPWHMCRNLTEPYLETLCPRLHLRARRLGICLLLVARLTPPPSQVCLGSF